MAKEDESGQNIGSAIFTSEKTDDGGNMIDFAEQFKDKVRAIHEHFDKNKDGFLNFEELSNLQLATSGQVLESTMYAYLCQGLNCQPDKGLSLDGLKLTYASEGANIGDDYKKVFEKESKKEIKRTTATPKEKNNEIKIEEKVFEVNEDGLTDISPEC